MSARTPIRIGFAGGGFIANVHAGLLAGDERVRVAAVYDPDSGAASAFARKRGARVAHSEDDLVDGIDALYICNPNALHAALAVCALDAGLHVFSEKPMATSPGDARRVHAAAERARGVYQAGFNRRFAPVYVDLKRMVDDALRPTSAQMKMNRGELRQPPWTGDAAISGGFLHETPVHMLDMARHLFGEPVEVVCRARAAVYDQLDDFSMLLTFASGVTATLTACAHATWLPPFERVELYGDHATAVTEEMERITLKRALDSAAETRDYARLPFEERWGYAEEDRRFVGAMCGDGEPAVSAGDALKTTELVDRCYVLANQFAGTVAARED